MNRQDADRRVTNPLFNDNPLKLGIFATNASHGCIATLAEDAHQLNWQNMLTTARLADEMGLEALVPVARWKGFGGLTDFNGLSYETYAWAAGLAQATSYPAVFATSHVATMHPVMAAKQIASIDHISGGRFALNIVCGWRSAEFNMFGSGVLLPHDEAYEHAAEWLEILLKLWTTDEEFDHDGKYFSLKRAISRPKPIQKPYPALMNAGSSDVGQRYASQYADMSFLGLPEGNPEAAAAKIAARKKQARDEFGRDIQLWINGAITCRPTEREANDAFKYYAFEKGDRELRYGEGESRPAGGRPSDQGSSRRYPGYGSYPLIGTPEMIVDELLQLTRIGLAGCLLNWVNYEQGLTQFAAEILPLMEQAGLRKAFHPLPQAELAAAL